MKICYDYQIFYHQEYGGVSRYHVEIGYQISKYFNTKVEFPCLISHNEYLKETFNKNIFCINRFTNNSFVYNLNRCYGLLNMLINVYDIVHPTWVDPYIFLFKGKAKIIITIHDMIHELFWQGKADQEIARKKNAIYKADAIIAISNNTKKDILKLYPDIPEEKIHVVYHGTSHLPKPIKPDSFSVPNKYVLYVGRRDDYKRGMLVAKAMAHLFKKHDDISLLYIGGGKLSTEEKRVIQNLGIENKVYQKNVTDAELAYLYNNALCFVYPSQYEGFGLPILEAFDNKCPVVCANNSSLPEVGGDAVLYFDNIEELSTQIEKCITDANLRSTLIKLGENRGKLFTWEKCAAETYEVYKELGKC